MGESLRNVVKPSVMSSVTISQSTTDASTIRVDARGEMLLGRPMTRRGRLPARNFIFSVPTLGLIRLSDGERLGGTWQA